MVLKSARQTAGPNELNSIAGSLLVYTQERGKSIGQKIYDAVVFYKIMRYSVSTGTYSIEQMGTTVFMVGPSDYAFLPRQQEHLEKVDSTEFRSVKDLATAHKKTNHDVFRFDLFQSIFDGQTGKRLERVFAVGARFSYGEPIILRMKLSPRLTLRSLLPVRYALNFISEVNEKTRNKYKLSPLIHEKVSNETPELLEKLYVENAGVPLKFPDITFSANSFIYEAEMNDTTFKRAFLPAVYDDEMRVLTTENSVGTNRHLYAGMDFAAHEYIVSVSGVVRGNIRNNEFVKFKLDDERRHIVYFGPSGRTNALLDGAFKESKAEEKTKNRTKHDFVSYANITTGIPNAVFTKVRLIPERPTEEGDKELMENFIYVLRAICYIPAEDEIFVRDFRTEKFILRKRK